MPMGQKTIGSDRMLAIAVSRKEAELMRQSLRAAIERASFTDLAFSSFTQEIAEYTGLLPLDVVRRLTEIVELHTANLERLSPIMNRYDAWRTEQRLASMTGRDPDVPM